MKTKQNVIQICLLAALLLPAVAQAQYSYTIRFGYAYITGPVGSPTTINLPTTINNYQVIGILDNAFRSCSTLRSVTIPALVSSIGSLAFANCSHLTNISVNGNNITFSSINGVLCNQSGTQIIQYPGGLSGSYTIPDGITSIGDYAFGWCPLLTGVTMPSSVTSIGNDAFYSSTGLTNLAIPVSVSSIGNVIVFYCSGLQAISVDAANSNYCSINGVLFDKNATTLISYPPGLGGSYRIPDGVTNIGFNGDCTYLTSVTIPASVTTIATNAFLLCTSLKTAYFLGNAPAANPTMFAGDGVTVYYLPGTLGWENSADVTGVLQVLWDPQAQTSDGGFGVRTNQFGFNLTGGSNIVVVVEASTNWINWQPLATNTLTTGTAYFSDPQWTNYPGRFYRLRSP